MQLKCLLSDIFLINIIICCNYLLYILDDTTVNILVKQKVCDVYIIVLAMLENNKTLI